MTDDRFLRPTPIIDSDHPAVIASIGTTKPMMTRIAVTIRIAVESTVDA